ncbi:interferon-related developmental regulator-domain-containing protein [Cercophora newfieldiana]|uniref:Interferon-related developmental regulator-domain-containing protein n=1 Tax=Cercophora newfieldiana TaxID=92897 RepID=A0AA40CU46_9PEZI|nr:interferon-related developmental regulator-domain-containing protein [Cercophora newfieldiana]
MRDLRKKALLESQKTVSRKARARPESTRGSATHSPDGSPGNSRAGSRANSRPNSRPGSRYASEDEGASDSEYDVMTMSTNSASGDDALDDDPTNTWAERLQDRIGELQDRKRNTESREATLAAYLHLVRHHFAENQIARLSSDIIPALLRSVREGVGEQERVLALKALVVTLLTSPSEKSSGALLTTLKSLCQEAEVKVKVQAIYALMVTITHGGGGDAAGEELLDFLLEIIESDGESVDASDSGAVVSAALKAWGFVASFLDDMAERSDNVMDAFIDQLDSTDPEVQSSAGTNIAFLFEAAREHEEETGESNKMQHHTYRIMTRMGEIVKDSSKAISKKGRRELRFNFTSIVTSLERGVGPGYRASGRGDNPHVGGAKLRLQDNFEEFGYKETLRVHNKVVLIDTWLLHVRVEALKMLLGGGLPTHYLENPVVQDMLETADVNYVATGIDRKR